jgi:chromate reductase
LITIISGTNRKGSFSSRTSAFYGSLLKGRGIENNILDLKQLPADFIFSAMHENRGLNEEFNHLQDIIHLTEKFVFVIPEYNGSFPGVLKAFLDGLQFKNSFKGKTGALVGISSGTQGSALAMSHLTDILHYMGMIVLPIKPRLINIEQNFNEQAITNSFYLELLNMQIDMLLSLKGTDGTERNEGWLE